MVSLVHALKPGEYGAAGICNGVSGYMLISFVPVLKSCDAGWSSLCARYPKIVMVIFVPAYHCMIVSACSSASI